MIVSSCANHISPYVCEQRPGFQKMETCSSLVSLRERNAELLWAAVSRLKRWVTTLKMTVKETKVLVVKGTVCFLFFCQWSSWIHDYITRSTISVTVFKMLYDWTAFQVSGKLRTFFTWGRVLLSSRRFPLLTSEGWKTESTIVLQLTVSTKLSQHSKSLEVLRHRHDLLLHLYMPQNRQM